MKYGKVTGMKKTATIEMLVEQQLCLGCGTCVSACPRRAISMVETPSGLLFAEIDTSKCTGCGFCTKVCPGMHFERDLLASGVDPFKGNVVAGYCGRARDRRLLQNGQSGGLIGALLDYLLLYDQVDRVLITQMPQDGSLRPKCVLTDDRNEVYLAQGSKYCPVAVNELLSTRMLSHMRTAIVGLPCHFHGLRNWQCHAAELKGCDILMVGLICANVLSYAAINHLVMKTGEKVGTVKDFRYRSKGRHGWPGEVYVRTHDGREVYLPKKYRGEIRDVYIPLACRLCFDKLNILADIVVGDPWNLGNSSEGCSVVLARTQKGQEVILQAREAGALRLDSMDAERIFDAQRVERKRRDWTAYTRAWAQTGADVPDFNIGSEWWSDTKETSLPAYQDNLRLLKYVGSRRSISEVLKVGRRYVWRQRLRSLVRPREIRERIGRVAQVVRPHKKGRSYGS